MTPNTDMELQYNASDREYAYISKQYNDDGDRLWATAWHPTEAQAKAEALTLVGYTDADADTDHHKGRFLRALQHNYAVHNRNVFSLCVEHYDAELRAMLREPSIPNPVDIAFIDRAGAMDFEAGHEGRAVFQYVYDQTKE